MKKPEFFTKEFWTEQPNERGRYYFDEQALGYKFLHYTKEIFKYVGIGLAILLGFSLLLLFVSLLIYTLTIPLSYSECKEFATINDLVFKFQYWNGCFVHYQGLWVEPENLISIFGK